MKDEKDTREASGTWFVCRRRANKKERNEKKDLKMLSFLYHYADIRRNSDRVYEKIT